MKNKKKITYVIIILIIILMTQDLTDLQNAFLEGFNRARNK